MDQTDQSNPSLPLEMLIRERGSNPINSQRGRGLIPERVLPATNSLDAEIDAALREKRPAEPARAFPPQMPNRYSHLSDEVPGPLPEDPKARAESIASLGDIMGKEEFQHRVMHRLLQRHFPLASIAKVLGVSLKTAQRLSDKLKKRYMADAKGFDLLEYTGRCQWNYQEWVATALRISSDTSVPLKERMKALRLACDIQTAEQRFLHALGFFEACPFPRAKAKKTTTEQVEIPDVMRVLSELLELPMDAPIDNIIKSWRASRPVDAGNPKST